MQIRVGLIHGLEGVGVMACGCGHFVQALLERSPADRLGAPARGGAHEVEAHVWLQAADPGHTLGLSTEPPAQFRTARRPYAHWTDEGTVSEAEYRSTQWEGLSATSSLGGDASGDRYLEASAHWVGARPRGQT